MGSDSWRTRAEVTEADSVVSPCFNLVAWVLPFFGFCWGGFCVGCCLFVVSIQVFCT